MKQVTLNFREVAVDGLLDDSIDKAVVIYPSGVNVLPYSSVHELWNCRDSYKASKAREVGLSFSDITHWIPCEEVRAAFKEVETP